VKVKSTAVNHLDLVEASGTARQILPIDLPWIPGHEFSGSSNRLAVTLRHVRQVMPCSVPTERPWQRRRRNGRVRRVSGCQAGGHRKETNPTLSFEEAISACGLQTAWQGIFTTVTLKRDKRS